MAMAPHGAEKRERTVLVAEDESMIRTLVRLLLKNEGYRVIEAANGSEALELSRKFPGDIDLLLTDIRMPHLNGTELARQILLDRPNIAILIMSAYSSGESEKVADTSHFIRKPFSAKVLSGKIRELLEQPPSGGVT